MGYELIAHGRTTGSEPLGLYKNMVEQMPFNAHPGLHKDARNLLLDLCGILLAYLLLCGWRFSGKKMSDAEVV